MDIKRDSNFVLFQAARATVSPAYFLCVFKHDLPHVNDPDIRVAIAQSTGDISGPLVLNLMETGSAIAVNGQVDLYAADWKLTVYEQTSSTNIDPAGAGRVVWSELVRVYDPPGGVTPRPPYDPCTNCGGGGPCDPLAFNVRDTLGEILYSGTQADPCGKTLDVTAPNGNVLINGDAVGIVLSAGTLDIPVLQNDVPVGALVGSEWIVPPCGASCDLDVVIIMNGVEVANITGLDPCEDNEIIVN